MLRTGTCCLMAALLFCLSLSGQEATGKREPVHILNAESLQSFPQEDGQRVVRLLRNVQLMHNGYLMQCDSANHFPANNSFEAFGRVVIFKDKTFLYGETLHYDGNTNIAQIRGKIVRLVDDKTVLRTFNLDFNTKQNVGYFYDGGTMDDKENLLESDKGYYYSNEKLAKFEGKVEMRNKDYVIYSDSLHYHTDREFTVFLGPTNVWHKDGFLSCEDGWYDKPRDYFHFAKKAYVLSEKQEMWADSIFYDRRIEKTDLYGNIQVLDTTRSVLAFGDEGHFENETREARLMRRPSVAYYEVDKEGKSDTLFLRADTLHFHRIPNPAYYGTDTTAVTSDEVPITNYELRITSDELQVTSDELQDTLLVSLPVEPIRDTLLIEETAEQARDSLLMGEPPEQIKDSLLMKDVPPIVDTLVPAVDSVLQYLFAYRNVRIFRSDGQGACDSLVYIVHDSLALMYYNPVIWNDENQISADSMRFITKNQELYKAEILSSAFIAAEVDSIHYNQIKGRDMYGHFRKNELYLLDVEANVQTVFFMTEEGIITNVILGESKNMQIFVKERKMSRTKYIDTPNITIHPFDLLPESQQQLKGLNWRDAERPKNRYEVCHREVRPTQRAETELLEKPTFPITEKINSVK